MMETPFNLGVFVCKSKMEIEKNELINKISKGSLLLDIKIDKKGLSGKETQRQKYNKEIFLQYVCPIISQVERLELSLCCLGCKNKKIEKSEVIIITVENYFRDFTGLFERVYLLIKFIYGIKRKDMGFFLQELEKENKALSQEIKRINSYYQTIYNIRVDSTHYNSPIREFDEDVKKLERCELFLNVGNFNSSFLIDKEAKNIFKKLKKKYKNLMEALNKKAEKDILGLLNMVDAKYEKNIELLVTIEKEIYVNFSDKNII